MKRIKSIITIIILSLLLAFLGGFLMLKNGWADSLKGSILESSFFEKSGFAWWKIIPEITGFNQEKTYLILFQNNLELRPSGGYLGNFGILKIKNAQIREFSIHNTNIFDGFGKVQTKPPFPLKKYLGVENWQMRDSNWYPDFVASAQKAEYFYQLQGGEEKIDAIVGINATILTDLLKHTGPIHLERFNKTFKAEDALYELEYEVEKGYVERGLTPGERKTVFNVLVKKVMEKLGESSNALTDDDLKVLMEKHLSERNILLYFKNSEVQKLIEQKNWAGRVKQAKKDYLMIVEANLGGKKSNSFIERNVEYFVNLDKQLPEVRVEINYRHTNPEKNWFNHDYTSYLRLYVPENSWLLSVEGVEDETRFLEGFNKRIFANRLVVPAGETKTVVYSYQLPESIGRDYSLLIQKQIGIRSLPIEIIVNTSQKQREQKIEVENFWQYDL